MKPTKPINIRITPALDALIHEATEKSGLPQADIMRQALTLGLRDLADLPKEANGTSPL